MVSAACCRLADRDVSSVADLLAGVAIIHRLVTIGLQLQEGHRVGMQNDIWFKQSGRAETLPLTSMKSMCIQLLSHIFGTHMISHRCSTETSPEATHEVSVPMVGRGGTLSVSRNACCLYISWIIARYVTYWYVLFTYCLYLYHQVRCTSTGCARVLFVLMRPHCYTAGCLPTAYTPV